MSTTHSRSDQHQESRPEASKPQQAVRGHPKEETTLAELETLAKEEILARLGTLELTDLRRLLTQGASSVHHTQHAGLAPRQDTCSAAHRATDEAFAELAAALKFPTRNTV